MSSSRQGAKVCLVLTVILVTILALVIDLSFKIIVIKNILFTANSVLSALLAINYLFILRQCTVNQQRHILNQALLALYVFSIGIFFLVNLPAAEFMRNNLAYQIIFEDIPRKFFASTLAFALSFYFPYLIYLWKYPSFLNTYKTCVILAGVGGMLFFSIDFFLLFNNLPPINFLSIYSASAFIAIALISIFFSLLSTITRIKQLHFSRHDNYLASPWYHYLVSFAVVVTLICLSCEYRLVAFSHDWILAASGIIFPLAIMVSNLVGERYGYKANLMLGAFILLAEIVFDLLLLIAVLLPSPDFFNLTPYYLFLLPRRIPATILALLISIIGNSFLLEKLKWTAYGSNRGLRILVANLIVNTLLCLVNYSLLFINMYSYEEIVGLALNAWMSKFILTLIGIPIVLWLYNFSSNQDSKMKKYQNYSRII